MNRKRDAGAAAKQRHEAPIDPDDMTPTLGSEASETEAIDEDGEPHGDNFA